MSTRDPLIELKTQQTLSKQSPVVFLTSSPSNIGSSSPALGGIVAYVPQWRPETLDKVVIPLETIEYCLNTTEHTVGSFIGQALSQIPEVEYVLLMKEESFLNIWTVIDKLDRTVRDQIYRIEFDIMGKFPELLFDFHVIARRGRPAQTVLPSEAAVMFFRKR